MISGIVLSSSRADAGSTRRQNTDQRRPSTTAMSAGRPRAFGFRLFEALACNDPEEFSQVVWLDHAREKAAAGVDYYNYRRPHFRARLPNPGGLHCLASRNMQSAAKPRPAPPIACCLDRITRRKDRRGVNRGWMKLQWQVIVRLYSPSAIHRMASAPQGDAPLLVPSLSIRSKFHRVAIRMPPHDPAAHKRSRPFRQG
ncbi:hypothetical protein AMST5_00867 [freshwater sediment metagenome]|uniref:Uncharacterized protein n=1 Tax=freshwater sediment metagenome TaxID=556182 RepID=A0AA48RA45_9ZZZZ